VNNLEGFLNKFKHLLQSSKASKESIISSVRHITHIELAERNVELKEGILHIQASPLVRSEIFMRKHKILEDLKSKLGTKAPRDIR